LIVKCIVKLVHAHRGGADALIKDETDGPQRPEQSPSSAAAAAAAVGGTRGGGGGGGGGGAWWLLTRRAVSVTGVKEGGGIGGHREDVECLAQRWAGRGSGRGVVAQ
jgi:hypothetical protein